VKRDFLTIWDLSAGELRSVVDRGLKLKRGEDKNRCPLIGKSIGLLFEKASTRTRVSFETGIYQLGAQAVYMNASDLQMGRGETIGDTAKTLSRYLSAVVIRTYEHARVEDLAANASVPVVNGLSDLHHPCQVLADLVTIHEKKGRLEGLRLAYIGDGNNVANSLAEASSRMNINLVIASPEGYEPDPDVLDRARDGSGGDLIILRDPREAAGMADIIYTDVWVSMGQEKEADERKRRFKPYQVNETLLSCAKRDVIVMHCLPAHRGEEISDSVMDGPHSVVFDQAENRLHAQKALLEFLLSN
jgi:ornithine carbamoyltransferase